MAEQEPKAESQQPHRLSRREVIRQNLELREEARRLSDTNQSLVRQLTLARSGNDYLRESRRAALNLMEDAISAREAERRESKVRVRAEDELRASEEKYRGLFGSIDEGFFIIERLAASRNEQLDFLFLEANPAVATQSGVKEVVGKTMRQVFPGESEEWYSTFNTVASTGQSVRFERELVSQKRTLELYAFRPHNADSRRVAVIFKDISERKAAEEALQLADRRKDEFLATLAHELRNPLAPICNSLQLLRMYAGNDSDANEVCEMMDRQVCYMVRLVDDLMEISRISRGYIELRKQHVDLASIIQRAVELSRPFIEGFQHELTVTLPEDPISLYGDSIRLGQIFSNLLNNAAKYTECGGRISLNAHQDGQTVVVSVRDTGIGIPPTMLEAVFDIFTQADRSSQRTQGGLGIGLTLAKRLVELHDGTITAHSEGPGRGSEFTVRLPLASDAAKTTDATENPPGRFRVSRGRVLVVDDNRDSANSLGMLLQSLGTEVRTAHDGELALKILESYRPDVVFLDIGMPGLDGVEVARRIREHGDFDRTMLVALTGWGQDEDRKRTREAGINHHLVKPADLKSLRSLLQNSKP